MPPDQSSVSDWRLRRRSAPAPCGGFLVCGTRLPVAFADSRAAASHHGWSVLQIAITLCAERLTRPGPRLRRRHEAPLAIQINDAVGNKGDSDMASIGLVYRFGAARTAAPRAPAPAPVLAEAPATTVAIPAPQPPPPPASVVLTPVVEKVTFASDALFDFDKSVLKPQGKAKLDELATRQRGMMLEAIVATGHTDSVGSDSYNYRLSIPRTKPNASSAVPACVRRVACAFRTKSDLLWQSRP